MSIAGSDTVTRKLPALDKGDLQEAIYALRGIFAALDLIRPDRVASGVSDFALENTRVELAIAGRLVADAIATRF
jgi:hypothetical protein